MTTEVNTTEVNTTEVNTTEVNTSSSVAMFNCNVTIMSILSSTSSGKAKVLAEYEKYGLEPDKISLNPDGTIDYDGTVIIVSTNMHKLPFKFNVVHGAFVIENCGLTTLAGAPKRVKGSFACNWNKLTSLEGAPEYVGQTFSCAHNMLTSLDGAPKTVNGMFVCSDNRLTNLIGGPETVNGEYVCKMCKLRTIDGLPKHLGGHLDLSLAVSVDDAFEIRRKCEKLCDSSFHIDILRK